MPELTPKLGIKKPLGNETVTRAAFNENWDIIDAQAQKNITQGATAPTSPTEGDLWIDTSTSLNALKRYTAGNWVKIGAVTPGDIGAVANAGNTPSVQAGPDASKPAPGTAGRLYVAIDTQIIYRDTGTTWQKVGVVKWGDIEDKPSTFLPSAHTHAGSDITSKVASASAADTVPWSGVSGKPSTYPPSSHTHDDIYLNKTNTSSYTPTADYHPATKKYVDDRVAAAGGGDMLKSVYDPDNDGKVEQADNADSVSWSGVSGKPSSFTPSAHKSTHATGGSDALTPADIGAAPSSHTHTKSQITDFAHKSTHATGGADALAPADIGAAAASDLNAHLADNAIHQTAEQVRKASDKSLIVEVSSSAPASPVNGQIWYDSVNNKFKGYANGAWV